MFPTFKMVYCTVCINNNRNRKDISYFNYPKESTRRHEWLKAVCREDLVLKIVDDSTRQRYRICEVHFERSNIKFSKNRTKKYLLDNAFPTLNLPSNEGASSSQCEIVPAQENQDIQIMPIIEQSSSSKICSNNIVVLEDQTLLGIQMDPNKQLIEAQQAELLGNLLGITCNSCYEVILGFRYSCVECVNFDLCARCEAMREHDHHYMLRVPGPRPEAEFKAMMADIRAALKNRPEFSCEVEVKCEPGSDDEDVKPIDPLNVSLEYTKPGGSGLGQDLLDVPTRPTEDSPGQPASMTVGMIQQIPALAVPSATHPMLAQSRQPTTTIKPLVAETVRTQTQSAAQSQGKVKSATEKRKLTSDQGEILMVPLPFKMPKEEPLHADSGDTGDRRGCASKEADFTVFTTKNKPDDDEEFDSG